MRTESILNMELDNLNILLDNYKNKDIDTRIEIYHSISKIENLILDLNEIDKQLHYKELLDNIINKHKQLIEEINNLFKTKNLEDINTFSKKAIKILRSIILISGIGIVSVFANKTATISKIPIPLFNTENVFENPLYLDESESKIYQNLIDKLKLLKEVYKYNLNKSSKNKTINYYNIKQIDICLSIIKKMLTIQYPNNKIDFDKKINIGNIENISLKKLFENIDETMENIEKIGKIDNLSKSLEINKIIQQFYSNLKTEITDSFSIKFLKDNSKKINIFIPDFDKLDKETQKTMLNNINNFLNKLNLKIIIDRNNNFTLLDMNKIIEENKLSN